jgi:hypothetical protein
MKHCFQRNIIVEGYSPLTSVHLPPYSSFHDSEPRAYRPLTGSDGQVRLIVELIAERKHVTPEIVLLAWAKTKGVVVVTSSSKQWRLADYIKAGDFELDADDLRIIDELGAGGSAIMDAEKAKLACVDTKMLPTAFDSEELTATLELAESGGMKIPRVQNGVAVRRLRTLAIVIALGLGILLFLRWNTRWRSPELVFIF